MICVELDHSSFRTMVMSLDPDGFSFLITDRVFFKKTI